MKLERTSRVALVSLAVLVCGLSALLLVLTTLLHSTVGFMEASLESVRTAQELEASVRAHATHQGDEGGLLDDERGRAIRRHLATLRAHVGSPQEQAVVDRLGALVERTSTADPEHFAATLTAARDLVEINVEQARESRGQAATWDRIANAAGLSMIAVMVATTLAIAVWLRGSVIGPLLELTRPIQAFATGRWSERAPEHGAEEIREVARTLNDMADALGQMRDQRLALITGVAHDLRNPLASVQLSVGWALRRQAQLTPERQRELLTAVDSQARRMTNLIDDLIDASRAEAGRLDLVRAPGDVRELVQQVATNLSPALTAHQLEVSLPSEVVPATFDAPRIERVLENLLGNAVKYSPAGGRIDLVLRTEDGAAVVAVTDQGVGIPPEELEGIFVPFRRAASTRSTFRGVGLGLATARRIVEAHGGRLEVESRPGVGSTFTVRLPLSVQG